MLVEAEKEIKDTEGEIEDINKVIKSKEIEAKQALAVQKRIPIWRKEFNDAPIEVKKMMLTELIDDVIVNNSEIEIKFKIRANSFIREFEIQKEEKLITSATLAKLS